MIYFMCQRASLMAKDFFFTTIPKNNHHGNGFWDYCYLWFTVNLHLACKKCACYIFSKLAWKDKWWTKPHFVGLKLSSFSLFNFILSLSWLAVAHLYRPVIKINIFKFNYGTALSRNAFQVFLWFFLYNFTYL